MSKGQGHSSSCLCKWCNQNFYGQNTGGVRIDVRDISRGSMNLGFHNPYEIEYDLYKKSYVNPNAKCPVCGESVYFCQLENDGRVFFDELAPFWIKHPCTDKSQNVRRENEKARLKTVIIHNQVSNFDQLSIQSEKEGWQPFKLKSIDVLENSFDRIVGLFDSVKIELFSNHHEISLSLYNALNMQFSSLTKDELPSIQVKRIGKHLFKISTFIFDDNFNVIPKEYKAFNNLGVAYKNSLSFQEKKKVRSQSKTSNKPSVPTKPEKQKLQSAMEFAFEKALFKNK